MLTPLEVLKLYPPHGGTLASMLRSRAAVAGGREFVVYQGRSYTYAQVLEEVRRAAAVLDQRDQDGVEHARFVRVGQAARDFEESHVAEVDLAHQVIAEVVAVHAYGLGRGPGNLGAQLGVFFHRGVPRGQRFTRVWRRTP